MDIQMNKLPFLIIITASLYFTGCGDASAPITTQNNETTGISTSSSSTMINTPSENDEEENTTDEAVQTIEQNTTITHIRVLEFDQKSQIPEHLVKIPINNN